MLGKEEEQEIYEASRYVATVRLIGVWRVCVSCVCECGVCVCRG